MSPADYIAIGFVAGCASMCAAAVVFDKLIRRSMYRCPPAAGRVVEGE